MVDEEGVDLTKEDVLFEEELRRDPYSARVWFLYLDAKKGAPEQLRFSLYERAVKLLGRSFKLWWNYLKEYVAYAEKCGLSSPRYEQCNSLFERALIHTARMPRIWLDYCAFLWKQKYITRTRRAYDRALIALPITQHEKVWKPYLAFVKEAGVVRTSLAVFRRYLMLEADHAEEYVKYLMAIGHHDEAARVLAEIVDDQDFVSIEGKPRHQLWIDLCDVIANHPQDITSVKVDQILRSGIANFTDQVGRFWCSLAKHFILLGHLEKARDVYEEAVVSVTTLEDFSVVFNAYATFAEGLVLKRMEGLEAAESQGLEKEEADMMFDRLEHLLDRRAELVSSVKLRQNPHNVHEWIERTKLFKDDPTRVLKTFAEAVSCVEPMKAMGKLSILWILFARYYEELGDLGNAIKVLTRATEAKFKNADDLASVWCERVEMEIRHGRFNEALIVARQSIVRPRSDTQGDVDLPHQKLYRSVRLWSLCADVEENFGTLETTKACYDKMFALKVITPQLVLSYTKLLEEREFFEESFRVFERAVALFKWPHLEDLWLMYLTKFTARFKGRRIERAREMFEQAIADAPLSHARRMYVLYARLEEEYGTIQHALDIYHKATSSVEEGEMLDAYLLYISKTIEYVGLLKARPIYAEAIEKLPTDGNVRDMCLRYAHVEQGLAEMERARSIYVHASQFCDPRTDTQFWQHWREFEIAHGNEDTFRNMLRVKRSVQACF